MRKVILNATITFVGILGIILFSSCHASTPIKLLPAYAINITFTSQQGVIAVEQGSSVIVPVTVKSLVDQPIGIRLVLMSSIGQLPTFLKYDASQEFVNLSPQSSFSTQITIGVSEEAQPGNYNIGINAQLKEPVRDRSDMAKMFRLTITPKQR